jgi:hypothetical protein
MSNVFWRLISKPSTRSPSPAMAPPRHLLDPTRDAANLDPRRSLTIIGIAATVLLLGAVLGLEGCDDNNRGARTMEFGEDDVKALPAQVANCMDRDRRTLLDECTEPRPADPDSAASASR